MTFAQAFNSLGHDHFSLCRLDPDSRLFGDGRSEDVVRYGARRISQPRDAGHRAHVSGSRRGSLGARRRGLVEAQGFGGSAGVPTPILRAFNLLTRPRFAFGTLCIFLYVGAEVSIGSLIVNYLMQSECVWLLRGRGGQARVFLLGRRDGRPVHRGIPFEPVLAGQGVGGAAAAVIALLLISANATGLLSGWSLLAVGLFNSIMFPTIFSLASEGLGKRAAEGSGVICMAIVGGAIVPRITGKAADMGIETGAHRSGALLRQFAHSVGLRAAP